MFAKDMTIGYLLDFYGDMLTDRTREILTQYYADDLSLGEIAESFGISRQGVRHVVKKAEESLLFWEEKLGLASRFSDMTAAVEKIRALSISLSGSGEETVRGMAQMIFTEADRILKNL